ncbi:MAG TPA: response regulator [Pyrinomonadaceae bacterium]|jgi:CheY-like chemotaxis protein|nr:response regulator [Pyrinomonadaceae bacterium]
MATADYSQKPASTAKGQSASIQAPASNTCVLVVEDHEDTRFMLRTLLELRGGIKVVEAENGESAIALAESMHPDLILMDTDLPLLDGYAATRRIRQLTSAREVPIVFLSGHAQPVAQAKAFAAGCTDYLVKPFALGEMERLIERHLSQRKSN